MTLQILRSLRSTMSDKPAIRATYAGCELLGLLSNTKFPTPSYNYDLCQHSTAFKRLRSHFCLEKPSSAKKICGLNMRPADLFTELRENRFEPGNLIYRMASGSCKSVSIAFAQRRRGQFNYFSLPPELRNETMRLVLVPGEVHIHGIKRHTVKATI